MAQKSIEDIRQLLDPQGYKANLEEVKASLRANLGRLFVNLDLHYDDPELVGDARSIIIAETESQIRQAQWRIERIDERIAAMMNGALPSRGQKRRAKKASKKKSK